MSKKQEISEYFDSVSTNRDKLLDSHPIVAYEQLVRQRAVLDMIHPSEGDLILDIGCGNGRDLRHYRALGCKVVGVDFSLGMLLDAQKELEAKDLIAGLAAGDATQLPFESGCFDTIACSEVIEHIPQFPLVFSEINRLLKPGGLFVITTPNIVSMYGLYAMLQPVIGKTLRLFRISRQVTNSRRKTHPYDVWKTKWEVIHQAELVGLKVDRAIGICYIPSHFTYHLPAMIQRIITRCVAIFERPMSQLFPSFGYMIGVQGRKIQ